MSSKTSSKVIVHRLLGSALIAAQVLITCTLGNALAWWAGPTVREAVADDVPVVARVLGIAVVVVGVGSATWTLKFRPPLPMLDSTAITLLKLFGRTAGEAGPRRTEPFLATGPYRFSRNPLYFGVVCLAFGSGLAVASLPLLLWSFVLVLWFMLLIPYEERELADLFGEAYERYHRAVPMLFPRWLPHEATPVIELPPQR
ncbi:MAG: methyltransferase family protein [Thermoplasmatota archaeon]